MVNHLCPWLLSHDETGRVTEDARSMRAAGMARRIERAEEMYCRQFEDTFDIDFFEDQTEDLEDDSEDEDEVNALSQELGSQKL